MQKPNIVIADIDGTIALIEYRRHWLDAERHPEMTADERWRKFFVQCFGDLRAQQNRRTTLIQKSLH